MKTNKRWGNGARVDDLDTGKKILLKSAVSCFITEGIKSTTIEDIAKVANVTRRTVYRYFNGKSDIIAALIDIERERMFIKVHDIATLHNNDFPLMLEECIWFAASYKPPEAGKLDLVSGVNASEASPHVDNDESDEHWRKLLQAPLDAYNTRNNRDVDLNDLISIVGRLVLSYRQLPTTKDRFKASIKALML
jgi:AcrR family transcriptional regulator